MHSSVAERPGGTPHFLLRQSRDPYVKLAQIQNYRCRSAFKERFGKYLYVRL